jgi:uncharacterized protein YfaQ (DUF2300 family)
VTSERLEVDAGHRRRGNQGSSRGTSADGTRYWVQGLGPAGTKKKGYQATDTNGHKVGPVCPTAVDAKSEVEQLHLARQMPEALNAWSNQSAWNTKQS